MDDQLETRRLREQWGRSTPSRRLLAAFLVLLNVLAVVAIVVILFLVTKIVARPYLYIAIVVLAFVLHEVIAARGSNATSLTSLFRLQVMLSIHQALMGTPLAIFAPASEETLPRAETAIKLFWHLALVLASTFVVYFVTNQFMTFVAN